MANILAFESFDGGSHKQFRETITRFSGHNWCWITLPPREWKWRMTIGAKELIEKAHSTGAMKGSIDLIFTTSLVDASALRSLLPSKYRSTPFVLYMHENQAAYPTHDKRDMTFALINLNSVLCADKVLWNSKWNLDSFVNGIHQLLAHTSHTLHNIENQIRQKSTIAWIPVELPPENIQYNSINDNFTRVVWPHRWEHDKGPEGLLEIARKYTKQYKIKWILLGEQFHKTPHALQTFLNEFKDNIEHAGFVKSKYEYWQWLLKSDWVLSTAEHEFFGIAVVEALLAGCKPWLPDRLSYQEIIPGCAKYCSPSNDLNRTEMKAMQKHLQNAHALVATSHINSVLDLKTFSNLTQ